MDLMHMRGGRGGALVFIESHTGEAHGGRQVEHGDTHIQVIYMKAWIGSPMTFQIRLEEIW
jgi:hypothetical protein